MTTTGSLWGHLPLADRTAKRWWTNSNFVICHFRGRWWDVASPQGPLTRARAPQQVLALRLVGVDGRYFYVVFRVRVQVFQLVGRLVVVQDGL